MRVGAAILTAVGLITAAAPAAAEPPRGPHVIDAPTAWVLPRGGAWGSAGLSHRGDRFGVLATSFAGLAELDVGVTDHAGKRLRVAGFKLGVGRRRWAAALGFRRSFKGGEVAELFVVGSAAPGAGVRLHAGAAAWDAEGLAAPGIRPLAGLEWTPRAYPRTTLLADAGWAIRLSGDDATLGWIGGWGVRYQALSWGSIELAVRHREGDDLSGSTVLVRVNGVVGVRGGP